MAVTRLLTSADVARLLRIPGRTIRKMIERGEIEVSQRIGRVALIDPAALAGFQRPKRGRPFAQKNSRRRKKTQQKY